MSMDQNGLATNFGVEFKVETSQVLPLIRMKRDTTTACNSFMPCEGIYWQYIFGKRPSEG